MESEIFNYVAPLFKPFNLSSVPRKPELLGCTYETLQNLALPLWAGPFYPRFPTRHLYSSDMNCSEWPEWIAFTPVSSLQMLFFLPEHPFLSSFPLHLHLPHSHCLSFVGPISWYPIKQAFTEFPGRVSIPVSSYSLIVNHSPFAIFHCLVFVYFPWYKLHWGQRTVFHFYFQWLVQFQTQRGYSLMFEGKWTQTWTARSQSQF